MPAAAARSVDAVKIYGSGATSVRALDGVSLEFGSGEFTAIMGPSGSGKSTLLHCLAGLDSLSEGRVYLGDVELGSLDDRSLTILRRERMGFVFQAFNLVPTLNAEENIALPMTIAGRTVDRDWFETVVDVLALSDRLTHRPSELSGGQQQRVAVARALVSQPEIVFADEPSGNLDSNSGTQLLDFLRTAVDQFDQTVVMVTHDANAASFADRVVFLGDGQVVGDLREPTADSILDRIRHAEV